MAMLHYWGRMIRAGDGTWWITTCCITEILKEIIHSLTTPQSIRHVLHSKVDCRYLQSFQNGDVSQVGERIRVILDCDNNTLSFERNYEFLGVAFRGKCHPQETSTRFWLKFMHPHFGSHPLYALRSYKVVRKGEL